MDTNDVIDISDMIDHLSVKIHTKEEGGGGVIGVKVGNVHTPEPSSPDFGIGDAIQKYEEETGAALPLVEGAKPKFGVLILDCIVCHSKTYIRTTQPEFLGNTWSKHTFCKYHAPTFKVPSFPVSPMAAVGKFTSGNYVLNEFQG